MTLGFRSTKVGMQLNKFFWDIRKKTCIIQALALNIQECQTTGTIPSWYNTIIHLENISNTTELLVLLSQINCCRTLMEESSETIWEMQDLKNLTKQTRVTESMLINITSAIRFRLPARSCIKFRKSKDAPTLFTEITHRILNADEICVLFPLWRSLKPRPGFSKDSKTKENIIWRGANCVDFKVPW